MSSSPSLRDAPAVDARLVAPESGFEIVDGEVREVPPADEPHGTRHSKVAALLEACVHEDYDVAVDMLTRTSKLDDFAPDASVFPRARDPKTGGRRLEELAFEIMSTQSLGDLEKKVRKLAQRGVRRLFAIDIRRERVFEWVADADTWQLLHDGGEIEDDCLAVPVRVEGLVRASRGDDHVARALLAKQNRLLVEAIDEGREHGRRVGREEGALLQARRALLALVEARGLVLDDADRARVEACCELGQLEEWFGRAATAERAGDVFG